MLLVPEERRIFSLLSVQENLDLGAYLPLRALGPAEAWARVFGLFPILAERWRQAAGMLSGGEQQMLVIRRSLMGGPRLLMLDEPSLGLAPWMVARMFELIRAIKAERIPHPARRPERPAGAGPLADRADVLEEGSVRLSGRGRGLLARDDVRRAYLGC